MGKKTRLRLLPLRYLIKPGYKLPEKNPQDPVLFRRKARGYSCLILISIRYGKQAELLPLICQFRDLHPSVSL